MSEKELSFLIVSDIHEQKESIQKLVNKFKDSIQKFDFILCCGDMVTIPEGNQEMEGMSEKYDPIIKEEIEMLCQIPVKKGVYYIPGNHDSKTLIENKKVLVDNATNLHKKYEKIGNKLYLVGLGGSVPIVAGFPFQPKISPYTDMNTKHILYRGYPYNYQDDVDNYDKSDYDYGEDIKKMINEIKEKSKEEGEDPNIILFTHIGPRSFWTNYEVMDGINAYLGSKKAEEIFLGEKEIFLQIHGHTHESKGLVQVCDTKYVMNPGNLQIGNYATLKIKMNDEGKWDVEENLFGLIE